MHLRILGSAPGKPEINKNQACLYVATSEGKILIDCGEGTARQLIRFGLDKDEIDAIIISHLHPDHISGIYMVLLMLYLNGRTKKLDIFLPESVEQFRATLNMFYLFEQKSPFEFQLRDINELDLNWIEPIKNDHLSKYEDVIKANSLNNKMLCYSFKITEADRNLIYTADTQQLGILKDYFLDADLVILDSVHPDLTEISRYVKDKDFKFIINHGISEAMLEILQQIPQERYEFADEENEIIV